MKPNTAPATTSISVCPTDSFNVEEPYDTLTDSSPTSDPTPEDLMVVLCFLFPDLSNTKPFACFVCKELCSSKKRGSVLSKSEDNSPGKELVNLPEVELFLALSKTLFNSFA